MKICLNKHSTRCAQKDDVAVHLPIQTIYTPISSRFLFTASSKIVHVSENGYTHSNTRVAVGAKATRAYISSVINSKTIGRYDDRNTRSRFLPEL